MTSQGARSHKLPQPDGRSDEFDSVCQQSLPRPGHGSSSYGRGFAPVPFVSVRQFELISAEEPADVPTGGQRLMVDLALNARQSRNHVAGVLFPEATEEAAHTRLRSALSRIRRNWPGLIDIVGGCLSLSSSVTTDVAAFLTLAHDLIDGRDSPTTDQARALVKQAELLPGWYEDWVLLERERLSQLRLHALDALARRHLATGHYAPRRRQSRERPSPLPSIL